MSDPRLSLKSQYDPELYELLHRGNAGDTDFYRRHCRGAKRVLELGCGYGRVLAALLREDIPELVGLERDPAMLGLARHRLTDPSAARPGRVHLECGDMTSFSLGGRFDRVLIPHSGIFCLLTAEACVACLACAREHLAPGGQLIFDAYASDVFHAEQDDRDLQGEDWQEVVCVEWQGRVFDVFERTVFHRRDQRLDVTYEYRPRGGGETLRGQIPQRYWVSHEVPDLLARAGLHLVSLEGGFDGEPFDPGGEWMVVVAEAKE